MRYVKYPEPITKLTSAALDEPFSFGRFFSSIVDSDERTGKTRASGRLADKAVAIVEAGYPGVVLEFPEEIYAFIRPIFEAPSSGYNPQIARAVGPWVDSILDAPEVKPA